MAEPDREIFIDLELDVRIRYRRTQPPPPLRYAITLERLEDNQWTTVRLWDNADAVDEHHEHKYTPEGGKQAPSTSPFSSVNEAMATAIRKASTEWPTIMRQWRDEE